MGLLILSLIFRLLLLVVASGFSWVLGMAIALQYPSTNQEIPTTEKLLRGTKSLVKKVKRFPQPSTPTPTPIPETLTPQVQLTEAQRQQLQTQLKQLQTELNTLVGRTTTLESQLGTSGQNEDLETRLDSIAKQLATPLSAGDRQQISQLTQPVFTADAMMVTLPTDVLFDSGSNTISSGARVILDNLSSELKNYKDATISIYGHTDDRGKAEANQELSFLRAEAVAEYLSKNLGDRYRFIAVGYGETRPLTENDSKTNRQRNRRIEVKIHP